MCIAISQDFLRLERAIPKDSPHEWLLQKGRGDRHFHEAVPLRP